MSSIDDIFKKPHLPSNKRKLEPITNPDQVYKSAKLQPNGDAKGKGRAAVGDAEDDDDIEAGPAPPEDDGDGDDVDDPGDEDEEGRFFGGGMDKTTASAMNYVDRVDEQPFVPETIDKPWLRKLALNFEKKISKNAELRAKFEDDPSKFMSSEADLDADIKSLSLLSEHPDLYDEFAKLGCAGSLVSLLAHENTDIAIDAIEIISELTDEDVEAGQEQWDALVNAMLEADLLSLMTSNLERLDEANETDRSGVYHSLSIVENLASSTTTAEIMGKDEALVKWLFSRARKRESPVSQNKQYAAEDLAILVQSSVPNRLSLIAHDGVDTLLQLLAYYRKRDPPKESDEEEFAENLFDCLTCLVDEGDGKTKFVDAEGIELCLIMLRDSKFAKPRALRLLDHALGGPPTDAAAVCERFVEAVGLKTAFGMFMKKQDSANTEHLIGILASLLRSLPGDSAGRIRTLAKFVEKNYEKIARLVQLRRECSSRVAEVEQQIKREQAELRPEAREELADEWFLRRVDGGLFCLQTIDVILAWLVAEDGGAKKRIVELLADRDESLKEVKATLKEQMEGITGEELSEGELMLRDMLSTLITFLE